MSESREFENLYDDWNPDCSIDALQDNIKHFIPNLIGLLEHRVRTELDSRDSSIYTGTAGISLLYYHLHEKTNPKNQNFLEKAFEYAEMSLHNLKKSRISFLCGAPGPLVMSVLLYHKLHQNEKKDLFLKMLLDLCPEVISKENIDLPDELLYGRVGYLYSLILLHKSGVHVDDDCVIKVVRRILDSGKELARKEHCKCPLMFKWHDKQYLGAAHGISGILYLLMEAKGYMSDLDLDKLVKPTVEFVFGLRFQSGNYPSSIGNPADKLIHWCHGASGIIHMLLKAFQLFGDEKYLSAAKLTGDCIWTRGLLHKGYGICHGVSGNAYAFLHLYQILNEEKYLYRALKFAEWCTTYKERKCREPDRPLCLFEGLAGVIYFLVDVGDPKNAAFPAFQL